MKKSSKKNQNLYLRYWLEKSKIETNKPLTNTSRVIFNTLYTYAELASQSDGKQPAFNTNAARSLAFFVMATPDSQLSNIVNQFDIYRTYLIRVRMRRYNGLTPQDLTSHDRALLNLIYKAYPSRSYDHQFAYLDHDFSLIGDLTLAMDMTSELIKEIAIYAENKNISSPATIYQKDGKYYVTDNTNTVCFHSVHYS